MPINSDNVLLLLPELNPPDHSSKVGGLHTFDEMNPSDVTTVFMPGVIYPSDFSDTVYYQYRKVFLYNNSDNTHGSFKVYGFNTKANNIVKFALEEDSNRNPAFDSDETIKNATIAPSRYRELTFVERSSDNGIEVDSWAANSGLGVWLRMRTSESDIGDALDQFTLGVEL